MSCIHKRILPEGFDFGMPAVELIGSYSGGLHKEAMLKRASAFEDVIPTLKKTANREYLHVITTGAYETYGCFVAGTPVDTGEGRVPIETVKAGDKVYNRYGVLSPVASVSNRPFSGDLVVVQCSHIPEAIESTPNHPYLVLPKHVMRLYKNRWYKGYWTRNKFEAELAEYMNTTAQYVPAEQLVEGDFLLIPPYSMKENSCVDDALEAYVSGVWLAEGCVAITPYVTKEGNTSVRRISIVFVLGSDGKDDAVVSQLRAYAAINGRSARITTAGNAKAIRVELGYTEFGAFLHKTFGRGAKNKTLGTSVAGHGELWLRNLLAGYMDGDGYIGKEGSGDVNVLKASTVSLSLALDIQRAFATLGVVCSVSKCRNKFIPRVSGEVAPRTIYALGIAASQADKVTSYCQRLRTTPIEKTPKAGEGLKAVNTAAGLLIPIKKITRKPVDTTVYNLEVAGEHSYCVPVVVHNSNSNGDAWNGDSFLHKCASPAPGAKVEIMFDGGLSKYHDATYTKNGAVFQEHKTTRDHVDNSGEIMAARYNPLMKRGELIIAVDTGKWARRLQKKANGQDIFLSVGADVPYDTCTVCHKVARSFAEHCEHFKRANLRLMDDGTRVCVMNDTPTFYDISGVDVPADRLAFVLRKVASGEMQVKEASLEAIMSLGARRPRLLTKAALLLGKLSRMEKEIGAMVQGDTDVMKDSDEAKKDFLIKVENFPSDEIIDECNKSGILLTPDVFLRLLGKETDKPELFDQCADGDYQCDSLFQDMEEDPEFDKDLMDGSFDQQMPTDLNLHEVIGKFVKELGVTRPALNAKAIMIVIRPREEKRNEVQKEASLAKRAADAVRRTYARYVLSFCEGQSEDTCQLALRKLAVYNKRTLE